ncbi:hypothetical protein AO073_01500 [Pseudomonas syringae ICMP 11293]|uniref:hypothetical protein n=1 Tax=Pseudomonas syringae TaxID=317 RepID=UPI000730ACCD|nr:hypothetical protein [Pseudomonas syringae]KTB91576.1 hypothetical protein AO073_01500 [Pseudomonas syringae ICMP 11293]
MSILESIGEIGKADKIYVKPRIPRDKANNAISSYAEELNYDDIVVLIDDTVFGNSKNGVIITEKAIIGKESFSDPFYFSIDKNPDVFAKKGFTSVTLYINDQKVISFTQPSSNDLVTLFKKIDRHIRNTASSQNAPALESPPVHSAVALVETEINPAADVAIQQAVVPLTEDSQPIQNANQADKEVPQQSTDESVESIFVRIENDTIIGSIRTMKTVNSAFNFLGDMLSDKTTSSDQIRRETSSYFAKTILRIRTDYVEKRRILGLMNNVATLESVIFAAGLLHLELSSRGMNTTSIGYILNESIKSFLSFDNSRDSNNTVASFVSIARKMASSQEELYSLFYLREALSNAGRTLCDDDMGMSIIRTIARHQTDMPYEDAIHQTFMEMIGRSIDEIGDISSDRNITYNARKCADVILDATQGGWR